MPLASHLNRRDGTYYFRIRVPKVLISTLGRKEIAYSLRTKEPRVAKELAYAHAYNVTRYFREMESRIASGSVVERTIPSFFVPNGTDIQIPSMKSAEASLEPSKPIVTTSRCPTYGEVLSQYFAERKVPKSTEAEFLGFFRRLEKCVGNKPINEYTVEDIRNFKNALLKFPVAYFDLGKVDDIHRYLADLAKKTPDYKRIAPITVLKTIKCVSAVFNYALFNGYIRENPASKIQVYAPKTTMITRMPFTTSELNTIFGSAFYTDRVTSMNADKVADFRLLILLGFFTGARMEELGRLTISDVGVTNGIYHIYIHGDRNSTRRVKNLSSVRRIPLPSKLVELGFDEYFQKMKTRGETYLFPSLFTVKEINGRTTHYFSKWFAKFLDKLNIVDKTKNFHSFRHTAKRMMRDAGIEKSMIDAYQGHATGDVASSYGRDEYNMAYSLTILKTQLERIDYSEIDFSKVILC